MSLHERYVWAYRSTARGGGVAEPAAATLRSAPLPPLQMGQRRLLKGKVARIYIRDERPYGIRSWKCFITAV